MPIFSLGFVAPVIPPDYRGFPTGTTKPFFSSGCYFYFRNIVHERIYIGDVEVSITNRLRERGVRIKRWIEIS
jgi:hypothetical protein